MPTVDALLLDGAVIVNMLKPGASKTFQEYSQYVFLPYVISKLRNVRRAMLYGTDICRTASKQQPEAKGEEVYADVSCLTPESQEIGRPS